MKNFKLVKDTLPKPLEFGEKKGLSFLQQHRQYEYMGREGLIDITTDMVSIEVKVKMTINFHCFECGEELNMFIEFEKEKPYHEYDTPEIAFGDEAEKKQVRCDNCKTLFEIRDDIITMIQNPLHPEKITEEDL